MSTQDENKCVHCGGDINILQTDESVQLRVTNATPHAIQCASSLHRCACGKTAMMHVIVKSQPN